MNRKIEALQEAAASKARESAERVEKALERMIKQGQVLTFKSVAHVANVSTAYLYKQPELRSRIERLRDQQKQHSKPKQPPVASDNSKAVIIYNLREENKRLRTEIEGLRRINESLAGRLYQLQDTSNLVERLKVETTQLRRELEESRHRQPKPLATSTDNLKVTPLEQKRAGRSDISNEIKQQLINLGIQFNSTLTKTLKSVPEETVINALEAFKEAMVSGNIEKPGAWLKRAVEESWLPNEPLAGETLVETKKGLSEWFDLARAEGIVKARQETEEGFMVEDNTGQWISPQSLIERGWTLDYLKGRAKRG